MSSENRSGCESNQKEASEDDKKMAIEVQILEQNKQKVKEDLTNPMPTSNNPNNSAAAVKPTVVLDSSPIPRSDTFSCQPQVRQFIFDNLVSFLSF